MILFTYLLFVDVYYFAVFDSKAFLNKVAINLKIGSDYMIYD